MFNRPQSTLRVLIGALALSLACASTPKRAETAPPRVKDSAPEKIAAQRAAAPQSLQPDVHEDRFQLDAARERKRQQDEAKARKQQPGEKAVKVTTPPATR
jgi:hypothetical protein